MNEENEFKKICKLDELKEKIGQRFAIDDVDVAVFRVGDEVFALNNMCLHQKAAIMYDGFVDEGYVTCPAHGWQFDLRTGRVPAGIKGLDSYEVKIENGDVFVKVFQKQLKW